MKQIPYLFVFLCFLAGCGGGGGSAAPSGTASPVAPTPAPVLASPASLANICTPDGEKSWVRSHLDDVYLWYDEIVNVSPRAYNAANDYFYGLLVTSKDRFSFTASQGEIDQYFQSGAEVGYGASFVNVGDRLHVSYTEAGSPAAQQNLTRGVEIVGINGVPRSQMSLAARIAALYPATVGTTNQFTVRDVGSTGSRIVSLTAVTVTKSPVTDARIITTANNRKVGYFSFTDHVATAADPLIETLGNFKQNGIDDLVLDVRYNGGGLLYIANELASIIGGTTTENKVFEKFQFNAKHPEKTNDPGNTVRFYPATIATVVLPQLNLPRVFVLTGPDTCSASESIINGLAPFIQVITIGGTTCGKPYGMIQKNNCSSSYFAVEFSGVNDAGLADYANGITPTCAAADDLDHLLGDPSETLLATALSYQAYGSCPASAATRRPRASRVEPSKIREVHPAPWRNNRVIQR